MPYKPQAIWAGKAELIGTVCLALGCGSMSPAPSMTSRAIQTPGSKTPSTARTSKPLPSPASNTFEGPWLLPRLDRVVPRFVQRLGPDELALLVDGQRVRLWADGSYEVGAGWLPVGRQIASVKLPARHGGNWLHAMSSVDDTWLFRSHDFTGSLTAVGTIDAPIDELIPSFRKVLLRLRGGGGLIALEPNSSELVAEPDLPQLPEYGAVAVVDEAFGALVDPLRGLQISVDGGSTFEPLRETEHSPEQTPAQVMRLDVLNDKLLITRSDSNLVLLDRRGNVEHVSSPPAHLAYGASRHASVTLGGKPSRSVLPGMLGPQSASLWDTASSGPSTSSFRPWLSSIGSLSPQSFAKTWIQRMELREEGGWPIEQALLRGVRISNDIAIYIHAGRLFQVSLSGGRVVSRVDTNVPRNATCHAAKGDRSVFFICHEGDTTSVFGFDGIAKTYRLGIWDRVRTWVSVTDSGVTLQGGCEDIAHGADARQLSGYCAVSRTGSRIHVPGDALAEDSMVLLTSPDQAVALSPPNRNDSGSLAWFGRKTGRTEIVILPQANHDGLLRDGLFVRNVTLVDNEIAGYLRRGGSVQGYRLSLDGTFSLGPLMRDAKLALLQAPYGLIPSSSGYVEETVDAGRTWRMAHLPIAPADTLLGIPNTPQQYGCGSVGCMLGDWLRLGWSAKATGFEPPRSDRLEQLDRPPRLGLKRNHRRLASLVCEPSSGVVYATKREGKPREIASAKAPNMMTAKAKGTSEFGIVDWLPFYGEVTPRRLRGQVAFERAFHSERLEGRFYVQAGGQEPSLEAVFDFRFLDALGKTETWASSSTTERVDRIQTLARWFGDKRYGETPVPWFAKFDVGGTRGLLTLEDAGNTRGFLVDKGRPILPLPMLPGHSPKRVTDFVATRDASYVLGTEPTVALFSISSGTASLLQDFDPRQNLHQSRLRLIRDVKGVSIAYLLSTLRLRTADVTWQVYPIDTRSGAIGAPITVPLAPPLRPCDGTADGWLIEAELDEIAHVSIVSSPFGTMDRGSILLVGSEQGLCATQVLVTGNLPAEKLKGKNLPKQPNPNGAHQGNHAYEKSRTPILGRYKDATGALKSLECRLEGP